MAEVPRPFLLANEHVVLRSWLKFKRFGGTYRLPAGDVLPPVAGVRLLVQVPDHSHAEDRVQGGQQDQHENVVHREFVGAELKEQKIISFN